MSRTLRRGYYWDENLEVHETKGKTLRDTSCRNPECCGSKLKDKTRRRERYKRRDALRKEPDNQYYIPDKENKW